MLDFVRQFYDKRIWWVFAGLLLTHLIAASVQDTAWAWIPLIAIGVATATVSYSRLEWGLAIAFLEIFVGGHGHLIDVDVRGFSLSIREVIFTAVMGVWLLQLVLRQLKPKFVLPRDLSLSLLGLAVMLGAMNGLATNELVAVFDDMNGYFTLAYFFPLLSLTWNGEGRRLLLQTFFVAAVWVALTTLLYLYAFTHLPGLISHELYTFVRDARLAEVTLQTAGPVVDYLGNSPWYFRVFQQSQAIVTAFELLLIAGSLMLWREKHEKFPRFVIGLHVLMISTIFASLSRSFWIGCVVGLISILMSVFLTRSVTVSLIKRILQLGICSVAAFFILFITVAIPIPVRPDLTESSFYKGGEDSTRGVAVSSRWNLLQPMLDEIWHEPIIGSGFGETVTYISDDPRIRAINSSGEMTTYRFEWGYHDLWLKMGLPGVLAFGWIFLLAVSAGYESAKSQSEQTWIRVGLVAGVIMFYITNIFSPYFNHPIGLAFIMFIWPFLPTHTHERALTETLPANDLSRASLTGPKPRVAFRR